MDMEKVIKGWECHMEADTLGCADCPYRQGWRTCNFADTLFKDVYSLLKEQEAVEPIITPWATDEDGNIVVAKKECGKCGCQFFTERPNFCENCGTPILWEGR